MPTKNKKRNVSAFLKDNFETLPKEFNLPYQKNLPEKPGPTINKKRNVSSFLKNNFETPLQRNNVRNVIPEKLEQ